MKREIWEPASAEATGQVDSKQICSSRESEKKIGTGDLYCGIIIVIFKYEF